MTSKKPKTFEEKVNAIIKYYEYKHWWNKKEFLPKFAYLADDELESLLQLGREIEQYAQKVAQEHFPSDGNPIPTGDSRIEIVRTAIRDKYPYLDDTRIERLTGRSIYYAVA